jgi:Lrp/AsnC family transcriptional regulator, leucine-responsive regulatory protein
MDDLDHELVTALVHNGRLTYQELARMVHLSANSTADRVRRLQQSGVIGGYHATLELAALGRTLSALSDVKLKDEIDRRDFERHLVEVPQVLSAIHTTGEYDYQLRVSCTGTDDLESVVDDLRWLGAREVHSRIVLGEVAFDPTRLLRTTGARR